MDLSEIVLEKRDTIRKFWDNLELAKTMNVDSRIYSVMRNKIYEKQDELAMFIIQNKIEIKGNVYNKRKNTNAES